MEVLNSREIAILVWICVFAVWCLSRTEIRGSLLRVVQAFLKRPIIASLSMLFGYIGLIVWLLHLVGLWDVSQIKNTIIWSVSIGIASLFRITSTSDDPGLLWKWITDNLKIVVLVEFIATFYTFHTLIELALVPLLVLIGGMLVVAEHKDEFRPVVKLLNGTLSLFGAFLIAFAVYKIAVDFRDFSTVQTVQDFYTPPLLSLLLLPFLYLLYVYFSYENAFLRLRFAISDGRLRAYAKRRSIFAFGPDLEFLRRWSRNVASSKPNDKESVRSSIREVKEIRKREKNPPAVSPLDGWSPYAATEFLRDQGLVTGDYHRSFDEWFASSPYLEIGDGVLSENVAYYVEGDELVAKRLKLVLNVNNPDDPAASEERFLDIAKTLFNRAIGEEAADDLISLVFSGNGASTTVDGMEVRLSRADWQGGIKGGYEKKFIIGNRTSSLFS